MFADALVLRSGSPVFAVVSSAGALFNVSNSAHIAPICDSSCCTRCCKAWSETTGACAAADPDEPAKQNAAAIAQANILKSSRSLL